MDWTCPNCGETNPEPNEDGALCRSCGTEVAADLPGSEVPSGEIWRDDEPGEGDDAIATVLVPKAGSDHGAPTPGAELEIVAGAGVGTRRPLLFGSNVVGRGDVEIRIDDPLISKRHAEIGCPPDGGFFLKDLASANGTSLNGRSVEYSPLNPGDEITLGRTVLRLVLPEPAD